MIKPRFKIIKHFTYYLTLIEATNGRDKRIRIRWVCLWLPGIAEWLHSLYSYCPHIIWSYLLVQLCYSQLVTTIPQCWSRHLAPPDWYMWQSLITDVRAILPVWLFRKVFDLVSLYMKKYCLWRHMSNLWGHIFNYLGCKILKRNKINEITSKSMFQWRSMYLLWAVCHKLYICILYMSLWMLHIDNLTH